MHLPLEGLRVVELGSALAGPFCCRILADLGADVIKVESPQGGDPSREWGGRYDDHSSLVFHSLNKEKRSITVDFGNREQVGRLKALIADGVDIVVQNLRPGVAERAGLGSGDLHARHPELILCDISAYGDTGPLSGNPGYEALLQAFSGIMEVTGDPDGPPARVGFSVNDIGTAMWAAIGVLSAVCQRHRTGRGTIVGAAMLDASLTWQILGVATLLSSGEAPRRTGMRGPLVAPNATYPTADGLLLLTIGTDLQFRRFCQLVGRPEMAEDPAFSTNAARMENRQRLDDFLHEVLSAKSRDELWRELSEAGISCAPVQTLSEAVDHPQTAASGIVQSSPDGAMSVVGFPLKFDGRRPPFRKKGPRLGEGNEDLLGQAG